MYWNHSEEKVLTFIVKLNSNIRCIEMLYGDSNSVAQIGWIVTLDVLKYKVAGKEVRAEKCWIVTLDVLKYEKKGICLMPCSCWIVTLDVLKFII